MRGLGLALGKGIGFGRGSDWAGLGCVELAGRKGSVGRAGKGRKGKADWYSVYAVRCILYAMRFRGLALA